VKSGNVRSAPIGQSVAFKVNGKYRTCQMKNRKNDGQNRKPWKITDQISMVLHFQVFQSHAFPLPIFAI